MADVTSGRGPVPPSTSQTTSTRTGPSTAASAGATTAPTIPESPSRTRAATPQIVQPSSGTETPDTAPQTHPAPMKPTPATSPNIKTKSTTDYSRLRVADNMSFSEAYAEAIDLNDQSARLKDDEQAALRSLHMIHSVSSLTCTLYTFWHPPILVAPKQIGRAHV